MGEFYRFVADFFHDPKRKLAAQVLIVACFAIFSFLPVIHQGLVKSPIEQFLMVFSIATPTVIAAWLLLAKSRSPKPPVKSEPPV